MEGKVRLQRADRSQVRLEAMDVEALVAADHPVRAVWRFVNGLDLGRLHEGVLAREGHAGRPPIDPAILMCLWMYATIDGVGSARELDRLTRDHNVYRWICGGVSVNYHTLSDFRVGHGAFLDELLARGVAALVTAGVTTLEEVAQDGLRARASAGGGSFRTRGTLEKRLGEARARVERLKAEVSSDPAAGARRRAAAAARAAREAEARVTAALDNLAEIEKRREQARKKQGKRVNKQGAPRASLTDPQARVIKMADGGFRPAYNLQVAMDTASGAVVAVEVSNQGNDKGLAEPMAEHVADRFGAPLKRWLVDTGFASAQTAETLAARGKIEAYMPLPTAFGGRPAKRPADDKPAAQAWYDRMSTDEGKAIYKRRSLVEWVNAGMRNRGLVQLTVRGMVKVKAVLLWQATVHNLLCLLRNGIKTLPAAA